MMVFTLNGAGQRRPPHSGARGVASPSALRLSEHRLRGQSAVGRCRKHKLPRSAAPLNRVLRSADPNPPRANAATATMAGNNARQEIEALEKAACVLKGSVRTGCREMTTRFILGRYISREACHHETSRLSHVTSSHAASVHATSRVDWESRQAAPASLPGAAVRHRQPAA
jgi:hypothetical protein